MTGRYLRTDIEGVAHRLYFEEAGSGIPLVCLHTAGADNRQYRHLNLFRRRLSHYQSRLRPGLPLRLPGLSNRWKDPALPPR